MLSYVENSSLEQSTTDISVSRVFKSRKPLNGL